MAVLFHLIWLVLTVDGAYFDNEVVPSCGPEAETCEFYWTIDYKETMVYYANEGHVGQPVVVVNDTLYRRDTCDVIKRMTDQELENVTTADGRYKLLMAINQQVPGPAVVVYIGQEVIVHVANKLEADGVTIHWHGLGQHDTPWMDGTGSISQCPIDPGSSFVYRFVAEDVGTSFYHAHHGMLRAEGIAGPVIVLPRDTNKADKATADIEKEYVMFLQDWFYSTGNEIYSHITDQLTPFYHGLDQDGCSTLSKAPDGEIISDVPFESAIINGKGRFNHTQSIGGIPYETFNVTADKVYRFRVISNTVTYAFRVSVDQHKMTVIATDGNDVTGFEVESVVVHSGERYDVTVRADQVPGSYWIRLETLDTPLQGETSSPHSGLAILWYQDTELALPTSQRSVCDRNNPCKVLNCPFIYRPDSYIVCTSVAELKASREEQDTYPVANVSSTETFQEIFLNFGFAWTRNPVSAAVNNKVNVLPSVPLQLYPDLSETFTECVQRCDEYCTCTHVVKLDIGNTVQLVLLNTNDSPYGMAHPIHIHGHRPHLIKMVYPEYDKRGRISNSTKDIQCDTPRCNNATWRNPSWKFGNVPDVDLVSPTRKDTVIVPRQGYVVLRMVADNPGYWFMHCHIEVHQVLGMSLVLQAGEVTDMPPLPRGFPTCGGYRPDTEIKENTSLLKRLGDVPETDDDCTAWKNASRKSMRNQRIGYILLVSILSVSNVATLVATCAVIHSRMKMNYVISIPFLRRPKEVNDKPEPEVVFSKRDDLSSSKEKLILS